MVGVSGKAVTDEQLLEITRAADLLGRLNDPKTGKYDEARYQHFLDLAIKTYSSTHGRPAPVPMTTKGDQAKYRPGRHTTSTKPIAIDLFCGLGGWTDGLLAEGYVRGDRVTLHDPAASILRFRELRNRSRAVPSTETV